jgi:pyrimidine-specific ribonucleoside hydrolase
MIKKLFLLSAFIFLTITSYSQKKKEISFKVIIDTDCGLDDARAISYLLGRKEVDIKAVIASEGNVTVDGAVTKITSLLGEFNRASIPVGSGSPLDMKAPAWRVFNEKLSWGRLTSKSHEKAVELVGAILNNASEKTTYVCLGPLTNLAELALKSPELLKKIDRIIWYCGSIKPFGGFNFSADEKSAGIILSSGVRIDVLSNLDLPGAVFDQPLFDISGKSDSKVAQVIWQIHNQPDVKDRLSQNHFKLWDDLVAIYLLNPELFDMNPLKDNIHVRYLTNYNVSAIREVITDILLSNYVLEKNIVFNSFPNQRTQFNYDIRGMMDSVQAKYGKDEWKACVMTDEFHGHLGVFSIVGAKMGIKACEIFGVGSDQLKVTSFAGLKPPYSCLTDGIQVSTGATLGMGSINVSPDSITRPMAIFRYQGRSVKICLKDEYLKMVDSDINEGIVKFGLMDDGYWKLIRRNAIRYWVDWDRNKIFDIEEIKQHDTVQPH